MKKNQVDYKGILTVLEEEIAHAKNLDIKTEGPLEGEDMIFRLNDITISCIMVERKFTAIQNGAIEEEKLGNFEGALKLYRKLAASCRHADALTAIERLTAKG